MTLFVFATTATETGVITTKFRFGALVGLRCGVMMIVGAIGAVHMRFRWLGLGSGHEVRSGQEILKSLFKLRVRTEVYIGGCCPTAVMTLRSPL